MFDHANQEYSSRLSECPDNKDPYVLSNRNLLTLNYFHCAKTILERLEADDSSHNLLRKRMKKEKSGGNTKDEDDQLALF
jgi:hypothetical protein